MTCVSIWDVLDSHLHIYILSTQSSCKDSQYSWEISFIHSSDFADGVAAFVLRSASHHHYLQYIPVFDCFFPDFCCCNHAISLWGSLKFHLISTYINLSPPPAFLNRSLVVHHKALHHLCPVEGFQKCNFLGNQKSWQKWHPFCICIGPELF